VVSKAKPMRHVLRIIALAVLIAAAPPARAQDDSATPVSGVDVVVKRPVTPLQGLEVVARPRSTPLEGLDVVAPRKCPPAKSPPDKSAPQPTLVGAYPADGQTVRPGYLVLRLTFDQPMACKGSLPQKLLANCYADGIETWHESLDKHDLLIMCELQPGTRYVVSINHRIPEHFRALSGREAKAGQFSFETSDDPPVTTEEAMVARDPRLAVLLAAAGPGRPGGPGSVETKEEAAVDRDPKLAALIQNAGPSVPGGGASAARAEQEGSTEVSTLRVRASKDCLEPRNPPDKGVPTPKLVSTFPAKGQKVRPGLLEVRFTFDLPMSCRAGVTTTWPPEPSPDPCSDGLTEHWWQMWDRRTMRILCRVEPGKHYVMHINDKTDWQDFQALAGAKADFYTLSFDTSQDPPVETEEDADDEDPLMNALINGKEADREQ
jgi:hypothetical protein